MIIQTLSYYELFEKVGLEALVFKSGELKDTLSGTRELSPEEKVYVQGMVDQMYGKSGGKAVRSYIGKMQDFQTDTPFDMAICVFTVLLYLLDEDSLKSSFRARSRGSR